MHACCRLKPALRYCSKGYISLNGTNVLGDGDYSFGLVLDMGFGIMPYDAFEYDIGAPIVTADAR